MNKLFSILFFALFFSGAIARWSKLPVVIPPKFIKDTISIVKHGAVAYTYISDTKNINAGINGYNKKDDVMKE